MEYIISVTEATNSHSSEDRRFFLGALYQAEALKPSAAISPVDAHKERVMSKYPVARKLCCTPLLTLP